MEAGIIVALLSSPQRGERGIILHLNNFTLIEVNRIQSILLSKYDLSSYLVKTPHSDKDRGYILKIPARNINKVRELVSDHIYPTLKYKIGL